MTIINSTRLTSREIAERLGAGEHGLHDVAEGYRTYTGRRLTRIQAETYNAAVAGYRRHPCERLANGCHNLFWTFAEAETAEARRARFKREEYAAWLASQDPGGFGGAHDGTAR